MQKYRPKYYDIRIKSNTNIHKKSKPKCEWEGCDEFGICKAPKSPDMLDSFYWFCQKHANDYNKSWNFFENMSEEETIAYQRETLTGHRPTWKMGTGEYKKSPFDFARYKVQKKLYNTFNEQILKTGKEEKQPKYIPRLQKQAYDVLGLDPYHPKSSNKKVISERYSKLVKLYHPDYNGGDRSTEKDLEKVVHAYRILKEAKQK